MRLGTLLAPASLFTAISLAPSAAAACWDGVLLETDRITISVIETDTGALDWPDAETQSEAADWLVAIDAILPAGEELLVEAGIIDFTNSICTNTNEEADSFAELFVLVGQACGRTPTELKRARELSASVYTVQILSTSDRAAAEARANELNLACGWHGFYERGGFPSVNPCAEVEPAKLADGREVYRVLVGNFLSRASADQARASIQDELGIDGMVRRR